MRLPLLQAFAAFACVFVVFTLPSLNAAPVQILLDTDMDADDVFAILYLLKQDRTKINLKAITISANAWSDAGHAVNLLYDLLYMMGRDDISVGVGGEGGISFEGKFSQNVGGYLPLIEQRHSTAGGCRYRQAIPPGSGGLLDIDTMYGIRKQFLPQGKRRYVPLRQPTAQTVMMEAISSGQIVVMLIGSHTNFAALLMTNPEIKHNISRIYIMGGAVNSSNPTGCCPEGSQAFCTPSQCGDVGNLFSAVDTNPWAEFNIFSDPFAAYQVFHSGIPMTLVPLDATDTIPISRKFFSALKKYQRTYEAQWVYEVLKIIRDTWFDDNFNKEYFFWDSLTASVTVSGILTDHNIEKNKVCVLHYTSVTVMTSNKPYGVQDGSNPFFDNRTIPEFSLEKGGIHSGHVQTGLEDPFCLVSGEKGKCMDGYTMATSGPEGVLMQVGVSAKPNSEENDDFEFSFEKSFVDRLNAAEQTALYNFETQFPCYKQVFYKPKLSTRNNGKPVIFDTDLSPGDIITLFYILKLPRKIIDLKAVTVTATGWSNAATVETVYDLLHMMGRDDIPVGLGEFFALGQAYPPTQSTGDCKYRQAIPNGAGGFIDVDTLFGLARDLPRSPRRYTAENSIKFGAPRNTDHPELRQPKAQEVIENILKDHYKKSKVTILTGGPLTNIATFLVSNSSHISSIEELYIAGGSINLPHNAHKNEHLGNVCTISENKVAEFNFFLDPHAAKTTLESDFNVSLVPLDALYRHSLFRGVLNKLDVKRQTPEARFVYHLLFRIQELQLQSNAYSHTAKLMDEAFLALAYINREKLKKHFKVKPIMVMANGNVATDGWTKVDHLHGKHVRYLNAVNPHTLAVELVKVLNNPSQSAIVASFDEQEKVWRKCKE